MRVQFVRDNYADTVEFQVEKMPTEEEVTKIYDEIHDTIEKYEEENGDMEGFDFWACCYNAAVHHIKLTTNPVVKTFYIF